MPQIYIKINALRSEIWLETKITFVKLTKILIPGAGNFMYIFTNFNRYLM